jgi:hypothetical protein
MQVDLYYTHDPHAILIRFNKQVMNQLLSVSPYLFSFNDFDLVRLETFIREAFVNKQHLVSIFFDLEKAYVTTWKYGILKDLKDVGLKGRLPLFISGFLNARHFKVRLGSTLS